MPGCNLRVETSLPETAGIECLSAIVSMIFQKERILILEA
jgi:hypothetical protein